MSNEQFAMLLGVLEFVGKIPHFGISQDERRVIGQHYDTLTDILREGHECIADAMLSRMMDQVYVDAVQAKYKNCKLEVVIDEDSEESQISRYHESMS